MASTGATTKKPDKAPASSQKRWWATARMAPPKAVIARPCAKLIQPERAMSRHASTNQVMGCMSPTVRTCGRGIGVFGMGVSG